MRVVGLTEVAKFIDAYPTDNQVLQAWISEMQHRHWPNRAALGADFRSVDLTRPPRITFRFLESTVQVDTLINFRSRVVLVTGIELQKGMAAHVSASTGNA